MTFWLPCRAGEHPDHLDTPFWTTLPGLTTSALQGTPYSRINCHRDRGEQEAHDNYISRGTLIPAFSGR